MSSWSGTIWAIFFFFQAKDGIRDKLVTGVQTCALPIFLRRTQHVHDPPEGALAHRYRNRCAGRLHREAAPQAFRGAHGDGAHHTVPQLLLHLERQVHVLELERLVDPGDGFARKRDVDDGPDDLGNLSLAGSGHGRFPQTAAAPPTISESSFVIAAWRALL